MSYASRTCSKLTALSSRRLLSNRCRPITTLPTLPTLPTPPPFPTPNFTAPGRTSPIVSLLTPSLRPRYISGAARLRKNETSGEEEEEEEEATARQTNQRDQDAQEEQVKADIGEAAKKQIKRPWQREGADEPPVSQDRKDMNKSMTKGKLLTTPTRLLKLVLPLPVDALHDEHGNKGEFRAIAQNEDIQPLALLVHPQQPLSYLERLIQAELPPVRDSEGREKVPNVYFLAEGSERDEEGRKMTKKRDDDDGSGKGSSSSGGSGNIDSYSGLGHEGADTPPEHKDWVRWSSSTEIGDFIRDAARGREFVIDIDGFGGGDGDGGGGSGRAEVRVGVPSFADRTHYMRIRLRRLSHHVKQQAHVKHECDMLAHNGAHRLAKAGFGALSAYWATVYFVSFHTDAGWDLVEPVTVNLAGLTTIMGGYLWFLFISRDLSYQAALKITVSRRQNVLYQARGFDPQQWEALVQDANALRREIRTVAEEYDVEWDEAKDLGGEEVVEVLEKEKDREERRKGGNGDDDGDNDDVEEDERAAEEKEEAKHGREAKADPKHKPKGK